MIIKSKIRRAINEVLLIGMLLSPLAITGCSSRKLDLFEYNGMPVTVERGTMFDGAVPYAKISIKDGKSEIIINDSYSDLHLNDRTDNVTIIENGKVVSSERGDSPASKNEIYEPLVIELWNAYTCCKNVPSEGILNKVAQANVQRQQQVQLEQTQNRLEQIIEQNRTVLYFGKLPSDLEAEKITQGKYAIASQSDLIRDIGSEMSLLPNLKGVYRISTEENAREKGLLGLVGMAKEMGKEYVLVVDGVTIKHSDFDMDEQVLGLTASTKDSQSSENASALGGILGKANENSSSTERTYEHKKTIRYVVDGEIGYTIYKVNADSK